MLSVHELRKRLELDFIVVERMNGDLLRAEAYRTHDDLAQRRNRIVAAVDGHEATRYRVAFAIPTLVGPGTFASSTEIGFDLGVPSYPHAEPATWIISPHVPYSPHFRRGFPVCIGEIWQLAQGRMLLGSLLVHVARLLNWDEVARGGGYVGWNAEAIAYHQRHYQGRPLNADLRYPTLPAEITHDAPTDDVLFRQVNRRGPFDEHASGGDELFSRASHGR